MHCRVTIDMLNPLTRVKEQPTVVQNGEITEIYKYLSNGGSPAIAQSDALYRTLSPEVCAGGLVCFEEPYTDKLYFDCRNKLTAYGSKISADNIPAIIPNTKLGLKLPAETVLEPGYYSRTWEFAQSQGNGTIKSVALTHQGAAHAFDTGTSIDTYNSNNTEALYSALAATGSSSATESASNAHTFDSDWLLCGSISSYINTHSDYYYYTSENYIFYIYQGSTVDMGSYVDVTFYIRRLPKHAISYYASSINSAYNRASANPNNLAPSSAYDFTRVLHIQKTSYNATPLYLMYTTDREIGREDSSQFICFSAKMTSSHYSDEPTISRYYTQFTFYIFSGDECTVSEYAMTNECCALYGNASYPWHAVTKGPSYITNDLKLIYWFTGNSQSTVYCRDIQTGELLWTTNISLSVAASNCFFGMPIKDSHLVVAGSNDLTIDSSSGSDSGYRYYCIDPESGTVVGSMIGPRVSNALLYMYFCNGYIYQSSDNNPIVVYNSNATALRTNYMLARVNLRTPVIKTSNYIMQVKFEIFID